MREWILRVWYFLHRRRRAAELEEEIAFHRAMSQQTLEAEGIDRLAAAAAAQRALGNDLSARERARDVWIWPWLRDAVQDLRFAARLLTKARAFALTVIVVLGVGLGVNHLFLTLVYMSTLQGLPIVDADRVLFVSTFDDRQTDRALSYPEFDDIRRGARAFSSMAAYANAAVVIGDEGRAPDRFDGAYLSAAAFDVIGVAPAIGRSFSTLDDRAGAAPVVMIGHETWHARYGGDPAVLGRSLLVNGKPTVVIGIVPSKSGFPSTAQIWLPLAQLPGVDHQSRDATTLRVIGRLHDDATIADGRSEIEAIVERGAREHLDGNGNVRARVVTINERLFGRLTGVWIGFITAALLVVVVCAANVANLMLARGVQRTREVAIRASLGASRGRVVRQLVCEAALLAVLGGLVGGALALTGVWVFERAVPANLLPYWFDFRLDVRVFVMLAAVSMLALLIFGVAPAFHASRTDVNVVLKASGRAALGRRGTGRWSSGFLVVQLGLSTLLLAHLMLALHNDTPDLPSDTIIATPAVLTATVALPADAFATPVLRSAYYDRLLERVRALPGIASAAMATALPRRGAVERVAGIGGQGVHAARPVWTVAIGPDYFETLGMSMVRGRGFQDGDGVRGGAPAIVNARFVELLFAGDEAIGRQVTLTPPDGVAAAPPMSVIIVGIAPDIRQRPGPRADPLVYLPFTTAAPATAVVLMRSPAGGVSALDVRAAALAADASVPPYRMMTMAAAIDESEWGGRTSMRLVLLVSVVSILLAAVGLYSATAYSVSERTQEIGLRMALGARARQVSVPILVRALKQVGIGMVFGMLGAVAWDRAFATSEDAGVRLADPLILAATAVALLVITSAACMAPAHRAMRLDPLVALRED